ncbi:MAG: helix-turn-helix domain-containing protein [Bacteroidaceae bacterium]|nr:helix-turn-helix domain-containing protein [Bacteroidaceae bacterium]
MKRIFIYINRIYSLISRQSTTFVQLIARNSIFVTILFPLLPASLCDIPCNAQNLHLLKLPNQEQIPADDVLFLMQDSEGALWYATKGGGICRDDGRTPYIIKADEEHPELLGSNEVGCLAEIGKYMIIGTFHGAYMLDKTDYSIKKMAEVDEKRIDDILVTHDSHLFLTSNKKIYEYTYSDSDAKHPSLSLTSTYESRWHDSACYVSHLYEDIHGHIWATQWNGGLIRKHGSSFDEMPWPLPCVPTDIADSPHSDGLWVGTTGEGIIHYNADSGTAVMQPQTGKNICIDMQVSADGKHLWMTTTGNLLLFDISDTLTSIPLSNIIPQSEKVLNRHTLSNSGHLLVAGKTPGAFALGQPSTQWYDTSISENGITWTYHDRQGVIAVDETSGDTLLSLQLQPTMTRRAAGGIWGTDGKHLMSCTTSQIDTLSILPTRPTAMADDGQGGVWLALADEITRFDSTTGTDECMISSMPHISTMTFGTDSTLWLGNIYGKIYTHRNGTTNEDQYATNEFGDAVTGLQTDSRGRIIIAYGNYTRIYDTHRHTLQQQSMETDQFFCIELNETKPYSRWSQPELASTIERIPRWVTSWWMWIIYTIILIIICILIVYNIRLRNQQQAFVEMMKSRPTHEPEQAETNDMAPATPEPEQIDEFLRKAIEFVEKNLNDEQYNVEALSSDMCVSRMTLYRKIQALTGQKPTELIRSIRLQHAAMMLREGHKTVTEVSIDTGFSSVSYFSRCFRSMFGVPPTRYS